MLVMSMHQIARIEFRNAKFPYARGLCPLATPARGPAPWTPVFVTNFTAPRRKAILDPPVVTVHYGLWAKSIQLRPLNCSYIFTNSFQTKNISDLNPRRVMTYEENLIAVLKPESQKVYNSENRDKLLWLSCKRELIHACMVMT